jgi:hypothetical protein
MVLGKRQRRKGILRVSVCQHTASSDDPDYVAGGGGSSSNHNDGEVSDDGAESRRE